MPPKRPKPDGETNEVGGAGRDRTDDLLLAKQALSQLSYGPDRLFELELYLRRLTVGR